MNLNLPLYNDAGLRALGSLGPFLRPGDTLMLVSGNVDKPLNPAWLERSAAQLAGVFPEQRLLLATAGLEQLALLAGAGIPAAALVYIYEPAFANVPEFSWEAQTTLASLERAADTVRQGGYRAIFKPTGRPLAQKELAAYGWHYGAFAERTDALFVQTQTYCRKGDFTAAVEKLGRECAARLGTTFPQVTLDLAARNGVSPAAAASCTRAALDQGFAGVTAWWSPRYSAEMLAYLKAMRSSVQ